MKVSKEFSKFAQTYEKYNSIQEQVSSRLLSHISGRPQTILDLGCGSGALVKKIDWDFKHFLGVDFAPGMLELHPKSEKIEPIYGDFNDKSLFEHLQGYKFDYILSASALQWAEDLEATFKDLAQLNTPISLAIFSANTFKTLNETASIKSLLKTSQEIEMLQKKYFNAQFEVLHYTLEFNSTRDMFHYIKQSGVSGARKLLSYKQTKRLLEEYPLDYLEFEVVFIYS